MHAFITFDLNSKRYANISILILSYSQTHPINSYVHTIYIIGLENKMALPQYTFEFLFFKNVCPFKEVSLSVIILLHLMASFTRLKCTTFLNLQCQLIAQLSLLVL